MILSNISGLGGTAWTISDAGGRPIQSGQILPIQYLTVSVGNATPPFNVLFNSSFGSRTATLNGVTSPDACCVYWVNDLSTGFQQTATVCYPWGPSENK
jgi:hypothetical protein